MRDERAHAVLLRERLRLAKMSDGVLRIELVRLNCDVTDQVLRVGRKPWLIPRSIKCEFGHMLRLIRPAKQQTCSTDCEVGPGAMTYNSARRLGLKQLLGLLNPVQCLIRFADLRQHPSRGSNRPRKLNGDISGAKRRNPVLEPAYALVPNRP